MARRDRRCCYPDCRNRYYYNDGQGLNAAIKVNGKILVFCIVHAHDLSTLQGVALRKLDDILNEEEAQEKARAEREKAKREGGFVRSLLRANKKNQAP